MATLKDIQNEIQTLRERVAAEAAEVKASIDVLNEQIVALRKRIDEGGIGVTPADLDTVLTSLQEIGAGVDAIIAAPTTPQEP